MTSMIRLARRLARRPYQCRTLYTSTLREPPSSAPRLAPTPLVFLSATSWDPSSKPIMSHMAHFLKEGFMCLDVNISIPEIPVNSIRLMKYFESELVAALQEAQTTFPPVIFARQCAGLISQTYISSHPATAMILLSPPPSNADVSILKSPLPEFNFEPLFPIALVAETADMQALKERSRLARDPGVDTFTVSSLESESTAVKLSSWLDELGV